jgi:hypothetical protein
MQIKLSPALKGLITAALMIGLSLFTFYTLAPDSPLHYLVFGVYALGIVWTLIAHLKAAENTGRFWSYFNAGFRCFVVVILLMVLYTFVFNKMHPEFAEESAGIYKKELIASATSKTPTEIDDAVASYKKGYTMAVIYGSIFTYLIIGVVVTALTSLILTRRN